MTVEGKTVFEQGKGLLVLVGVADGDTKRGTPMSFPQRS